jgi:mannose-6-phosphate isomerase-like protein (cupin superfamily)
MWIYGGAGGPSQAALVYQETKVGHSEEFRHHKSAFFFYIVEGTGEWIIEGVRHPVEATDVVVVPPGQKFYYTGDLKQICITAPAWEEAFEEVVRKVEL